MNGRFLVPAAILLCVAALGCEHPSHSPSAPVADSVVLDSIERALRSRQAAAVSTPGDDAALHRWSDAAFARADSLVEPAPHEARSILRTTLRAYRRLGDSTGVAASLRALGETYEETSTYDRADSLYRKALDRSEGAGARSEIASVLHNLGDVHRKNGRYEAALRRYQDALDIRQSLDDRKGQGQTLNNIGLAYENQGRFDKAVKTYEASLDIKRALGDRSGIAATLNNIGIVRAIQGEYTEARRRWEASLSVKRSLGDRTGVAYTLNNLGNIYEDQGQFGKALEHFQESLQILRSLEDREGVASALNNIGLIHQSRDEFDDALARYREALTLKRKIGDRRGISRTLTNMASIFQAQGDSEKALSYHESALAIKRESGDQRGIANSLNDIGTVYESRGRLTRALQTYRSALEINRRTGNRPSVARNLRNIGTVLLRQEQLDLATDTLRRAVQRAEQLRQSTTSAEARRSLLGLQIEAYRALTTARLRRGQTDAALRSLERARARLLADHLAGAARTDTSFTIPPASQLRKTLDADEAALLFSRGPSGHPLTGLLVLQDTVITRALPDVDVLASVDTMYDDELRDLRRRDGDLIPGARRNRARTAASSRTPLAEVIRLYRHQVTRVPGPDAVQTTLARKLHDLLVGPLLATADTPTDLIIVPTGILGYLPFEALRNPTGRYLVEDHSVRYAQSLTILRQLRDRAARRGTSPDRRRSLLALGGATYGPKTPAEDGPLLASARGDDPIRSERRATTVLRAAKRELDRGKSPRAAYDELGYGEWPSLYGTKLEVQKLERAMDEGATVLTGRAASEQRLRQLSASGELARYRHLHFATHGIAVPEAPQLSALVLSQENASNQRASRDGYLTMDEIVDLELRADVAALSACRTGIGRIVAGEGVVTLSHAFLRAGANATLVSQWRLLDWSTQQFMTATYRRAETPDVSFADAVTQVKRAFIDGTFGTRNTDPLRWAPFVYYGHE